MKQKYLLALPAMIVVGATLVLTLLPVRSVRSDLQASTPTPTYEIDPIATIVLPIRPTAIQPTIVDLASNIPYEDKPSVVVQHPDGNREMFLLSPDTVDAFIQNLPKGDELKLVIPAPAASFTHEPP